MAAVAWRTCVVCREKRPKIELWRLAIASGTAMIDRFGRLGGRGAYCCKHQRCMRGLVRYKKRFTRAFRVDDFRWDEELKAFSGVNDE